MSRQPFTIEVNEATKTMEMMISGTFTAQDYEDFVTDYTAKTSSINTAQYYLVVDCKTMDLLTPGEVEKLRGSFIRYKESGFVKSIFIIMPSQSIMQMQLERIARKAGLTNYEVVVG